VIGMASGGRHPRSASALWRCESGSALGSWIVQALLVLAVLAFVGYELIAIGLTSFALDDASREVARAARDAYRSSDGSLDGARSGAVEAAELHQADVADVAIDGEDLEVTLTRRAPTVLLDRFGPTEDLTVRTATGRAPLTPR
jgi:hypothetical protein